VLHRIRLISSPQVLHIYLYTKYNHSSKEKKKQNKKKDLGSLPFIIRALVKKPPAKVVAELGCPLFRFTVSDTGDKEQDNKNNIAPHPSAGSFDFNSASNLLSFYRTGLYTHIYIFVRLRALYNITRKYPERWTLFIYISRCLPELN
jgi:hypothetical protein